MTSLKQSRALTCIVCLGQALISAIYAPAKAADPKPAVSIGTGQLRGSLTAEGVAVFKNIPFAQPPVGELRWREPLPAKAWTGVRDATAFGPMCNQNDNKQLPHSEDKLRALPDNELMAKAAQGGPGLGINVDGWVLTEPASKVYADGREQKVALLIGNNSQEMQPRGAPGDIRQTISQRYGPLFDRALAAYGVNGANDPKPDPENGTVLLQFTTDNSFRCGTVQELIWHTTAGNRGYEYQFSRTVHGKEALGAPHASEIPFIFGTLSVWQNMRKYDDSDQQYAPQMQEYWTNFARIGDPNGGKLVKWPAFDATARAYMDFTDAGPVAKEGLRRQACDVFMENQKRQAQ